MSGVQDNLVSAEEVMRRVGLHLLSSQGGPVAAPVVGKASFMATSYRGELAGFEFKSEYELSDFINHEDEEFVEFAYRAILLRKPDGEGLRAYVAALRDGRLSKVDILGQFRWSEEGMRHQVHIDGLLLPYKFHSWRRAPLIGGFLSLCACVLRLPQLLKEKQRQIGRLAQRTQTMSNDVVAGLHDHSVRLSSVEQAFQSQPGAEAFRAVKSQLDDVSLAMRESADAYRDVSIRLAELEASVGQLERQADDMLVRQLASTEANSVVTVQHTESAIREPVAGIDKLYAEYEGSFRGSSDEIKIRLEPYIKVVIDLGLMGSDAMVLDLGCGRGEWLEMLREKGVNAEGVDLNSVFIADCRDKGLVVSHCDAFEKLRSLPPRSVGLVSMMHLAEHLAFEDLIRIIDEVHRVLTPGGGFIIETPNPENDMVARIGFYMDPTHRNPLPPQMLSWMVRARGFAQSDILPLYHGRPQTGLPLLGTDIPAFDVINDLANSTRAALDYAIVARKGVATA